MDPGELAVRAVTDRAEVAELVSRYGTPLAAPLGAVTHTFPGPATLVAAGRTHALIRALADGSVRLDPGVDPERVRAQLLELPGMSARAVACVRMRALGDPDVLLPEVERAGSER